MRPDEESKPPVSDGGDTGSTGNTGDPTFPIVAGSGGAVPANGTNAGSLFINNSEPEKLLHYSDNEVP